MDLGEILVRKVYSVHVVAPVIPVAMMLPIAVAVARPTSDIVRLFLTTEPAAMI